jgi:protein involved in plasmid replication-relaxation
MTQRDLGIISMVYEYEGCGVEHIRKVFFQGATGRSVPCYRRLAYLVKAGYLRSLLLPALNKYFLTPGTKAQAALSSLLKGSEIKRIRIESPMLILHKLAICDIRVSLELASKASALFLLSDWVNESVLRQSPLIVEDPETKKQTFLIPDAGFTLLSQTTGRKADFFLEMDMATVSLKAIRQRLRGYLLRKDPWPVLFVVPDSGRQKAISQVALEEARLLKANPTMVWLTTKDRITPETALSAPWVVVGRETPVTFQGLAEPVNHTSAVVFAVNGGQLG